ncbi:MAG: VOC family protein, partial [Bacteroidota bacterium]
MALFNGVPHRAIICSDYQVSKRFFHELLGLEIIREVFREERDSW